MEQAKLHNNTPLAGENSIGLARSLTKKQLIDYKDKLELTSEQKEVLIGTLLGDSSMSIRSGKPHYSVKFEQGESHKDYVDHLYQIFEPYTGSPPSMRFIDSKKTRRAYGFRTYQHKHFMYYFHLFYVISPNREPNIYGENTSPKFNKIKIVPKNIHKYLTPRVLAYWFMDDGTFHRSPHIYGAKQKNYLFSTQGFQKYEVKRLCDALRYKFNIRANVVGPWFSEGKPRSSRKTSTPSHRRESSFPSRDKKNWRIYILKESSSTFLDLIRPYIHQSFLYKI